MSDKTWYLIFYFLVLLTSSVLAFFKVISPELVVALIGGVLGHGLGSMPSIANTPLQPPPTAG